MNRILLFLVVVFVSHTRLTAQSISYSYVTPQQAANILAEPGVHVSNVTFTGNPNQLIEFSNSGSTMPISSGIAITTGKGAFAGTKNTSNSGDALPAGGDTPDDPDLTSLGAGNQYETAYLEFDFTQEDIYWQLAYVFASEEYNSYAGSSYHDQMGIFLSGPGITGSINLAKIGGSNVSVNTVNACTNSSNYINNCIGNAPCAGTRPQDPCAFPSSADVNMPYNGCTKSMYATYTKSNCDNTQMYHLKIAICNIGDVNYDSGVFLQAGSFSGPGMSGKLSANPSPVCNGTPFLLTYTWDPNQNAVTQIDWSTGQSGGPQQNSITTTADINNPVYTVTVTAGVCKQVTSITIDVHTNQNVAPYENGFYGGGDRIVYERVNQGYCLPIPTYDAPNERTIITGINMPEGHSLGGDPSFHQIGNFCYSGSGMSPGFSTADVYIRDQNVCGFLASIATYTIKSMCKSCELDIYYQNRQPANHPLPEYTKAGRWIVAGDNVLPASTPGVVSTGTNNVEFKAGDAIMLTAGFIGGPGYWGHIDPNTCVDDCEDCCRGFAGFHYDPVPNVVTPNNDGVNDVWHITDYDHPLCAYGATSFDLTIFDRSQPIWHLTGNSPDCCPFTSPSQPGTSEIASIYWDPRSSNAIDANYSYVLEMSGCGQSIGLAGYIQVFGSSENRGINTDSSNTGQLQANASQPENGDGKRPKFNDDSATPDFGLSLYPNPSKDEVFLTFHTTDSGSSNFAIVEIYNSMGSVMERRQISVNESNVIDVKSYKPGVYIVKATSNFTTFSKSLVKVP